MKDLAGHRPDRVTLGAKRNVAGVKISQVDREVPYPFKDFRTLNPEP